MIINGFNNCIINLVFNLVSSKVNLDHASHVNQNDLLNNQMSPLWMSCVLVIKRVGDSLIFNKC